MRWTAKAGQDKLEWSILDVEADEWERRLAELGVAAAASRGARRRGGLYHAAPRHRLGFGQRRLGNDRNRAVRIFTIRTARSGLHPLDLAGAYGIDVLPGLLRGLGQYDNWEELAPAVFSVSATELEEGWHTAMREEASGP